MSNSSAVSYARVALQNLIENKSKITPDTLFYEMHYLFDIFSEESIIEEDLKRIP